MRRRLKVPVISQYRSKNIPLFLIISIKVVDAINNENAGGMLDLVGDLVFIKEGSVSVCAVLTNNSSYDRDLGLL
jgi:hypothetical protein